MISAKEYSPVIFNSDYNPERLRKGTSAYHRFWDEQYDRCLNGYQPTGGSYIPGNYYFYLNFCKIRLYDEKTNRKTIGPPLYRDQDHEYFVEVNEAKKGGYGIIVLKARRKGFSYMNSDILLHEWTFYQQSESGMGAQKEHYVSDFRDKLLLTYNNIRPEFRNHFLINNSDLFTSGWKEKENNIWVEKGMGGRLYFRLIEKPDTFRGTSLGFWIVDEAGEVVNLKKVYYANEECFREGSHQYGVPIIGGTSNKMSHDSDDFMRMWYDAEDYNLKRFFVSANKVYYPFFDNNTGISDTTGATKDILKRLKEKEDDKAAWYTFKQEMPLSPEDAFVVHGTTPFDLDKINRRITELNTNKDLRIWQTGYLDWPSDKDGNKIFGGKPVWVLDNLGPMKMIHRPLPELKNSHVAAVDPYHVADDMEEDKGKKLSKKGSKGCMYVYRRFIDMHTVCELPVFEYCDRPYSKEEFYENCLKIAVYFDSQILIEYNDDGFLKYFTSKKMTRFLMLRPKSADSPWSVVANKYGIHMKEYQKNMMIELIDEFIKNGGIDRIYFPVLLSELVVFGAKNTDRVMAFGMSLIADNDTLTRVKRSDDETMRKAPDELPGWEARNGGVISTSSAKGDDPFDINNLYNIPD
jgi:hypothetical protein